MDTLFDVSASYEEYKNVLVEPLYADYKSTRLNRNYETYAHCQNSFIISNNAIKQVHKCALIKGHITCLYFIYVDFGKKWDNKYWFFIGKLDNDIYFMYESGCCGTGFGLGSKSTLYLSKTPELLCKYGLTDKHRDLISNNIDKRFTTFCDNPII